MDGLPVTVRLLDPPLHEFLPHSEEDMVALAHRINKPLEKIRAMTESLKEVNPMLGFRGCRLSIVHPEVTEMQLKAIISAAVRAIEEGLKPLPEIMIPLVVNVREIRLISEIIDRGIQAVMKEKHVSVPYKIGTMMETPRAALGADRLAPEVAFMSFGTNDLTQMTYGLSRDDAGRFMNTYVQQGVFPEDPFHVLDVDGVGELLQIGAERGRATRKDLTLSICGEHGGNPESIAFCRGQGFDYVSCRPFRVPLARLAAAHLALADHGVRRISDAKS
jgi:pyruvate,orthophosphate dikinase